MLTHRTVHIPDAAGTILDWFVSPAFAVEADLSSLLEATGSPWGVDHQDADPTTPDGPEPRAGVSYTDARWVLTNGPDVTLLKERVLPRVALVSPPGGEVLEGATCTLSTPASSLVGERSFEGQWRREHLGEDGLLDWSEFCYTPQWRFVAAACQIEVDQADRREVVIESTGPFRLWLDDQLVAEGDEVRYMEPAPTRVSVWLPSGSSTLRLVGWQVAFREVRQVYRVRISGLPVRVVLPSTGADEAVAAWAERCLDSVGLTRWGSDLDEVLLTGPTGLVVDATLAGHERRIEFTGEPVAIGFGVEETGEDDADLAAAGSGASMLAQAADEVELRVADLPSSPIVRRLPFARLPERYRPRPVGSPEDWKREFLEHAVTVGGTASALAAHTLDADNARVEPIQVEKALWMINNRADCADFEAVGLAHLLHRVPARQWAEGLRERVIHTLLNFKFWIDQPGLDAMCYFTENHQFVWHTAEHLVGSLFADEVFPNSGWTGAQHAEHGRALAMAWLDTRLAGGFAEFDSNAYLAIDCLAAISLVEFGTDPELAARAAGLADRVLLSLATNSWHGIHGAAHGRSYVQTQRSSRLEETAPIQWICFGMGALNEAVLPTAVIATARRYRVPEVARALATSDETTTRVQRYGGTYRFEHDLLSRPYQSTVVVHRRPEGMLSSVQAYRTGLPGLQEHVWGATLAPEVQVTVTHAPNSSVSPSSRPNAWAGNRLMPRVHQHGNLLIALYRWGADDPTALTHAWFPTTQMSEVRQRGPWWAGRVDDGYVALACEGGARLVAVGATAAQELRPLGPGTAWVCVLGGASTDGTFDEFVAGLPEPDFAPGDLGTRAAITRRDASLEVSWQGPVLVDGHVQVEGEFVPGLSGPGVGGDGTRLWWDWEGHHHEIDLTRGRA